jgi:phage terminase large subunit-like protein
MPHYADVDYFDAMPPKDEWKPTYWTPMKTTRSLGPDIAKFIEEYLEPPRDDMMKVGDEFKVTEWQYWWLCHAFELDEEGFLIHNTIFLEIPRKNGKSFLASGIMLYFLFKSNGGEELYCAAKNSKQARIVYGVALDLVYANPTLQKAIKPTRDVMTNKFTGVKFQPLSSDAGGAHGKAVYGATFDELQAVDTFNGTSTKGVDMFEALTTGSKDRREWFILLISTVGPNDKGLAKSKHDYGVAVSTGQIVDDSFSFTYYGAEDDDDISSEDVWRKCNPQLSAGLLNIKEFRKEYNEGEKTSTKKFEMFALNKWLRGGDKAQFISGFHWKEAMKPELGKIPKGADITVGFDGSLTEDSTGIVAIDINTGLIEVLYGWEKPPGNDDWFVDISEVNSAIEKVFSEYNVLKLYADPSRHRSEVQAWRKAYGSSIVREMPPTSSRSAPMSQEFKSDLYTGELFHVGERRLTEHVTNAIETIKGVPNKDKPQSPRKIDFLACAILANGARHEILDKRNRAPRRVGIL